MINTNIYLFNLAPPPHRSTTTVLHWIKWSIKWMSSPSIFRYGAWHLLAFFLEEPAILIVSIASLLTQLVLSLTAAPKTELMGSKPKETYWESWLLSVILTAAANIKMSFSVPCSTTEMLVFLAHLHLLTQLAVHNFISFKASLITTEISKIKETLNTLIFGQPSSSLSKPLFYRKDSV